MARQETEYDVLVVGTGASGMSAAVTAAFKGLKVLVVEKAPVYGGTTARSGGWLWIPGTKLAEVCRKEGFIETGKAEGEFVGRTDTILKMPQFPREEIL